MNENGRRWLSIREVSKLLNVHEITLYRLIARGQVPAARLGGRLFIDWKRLEEQLEAQTDRRAK
jgi:excisionase family DNA binding protein